MCGLAACAAATDRPAAAALTNGRSPASAELGMADRRGRVARQRAGLLEVERKVLGAGEVVGRADGDDGERHAELRGAQRGRADRAVAAGDDDAVGRARRRQRGERAVVEVAAVLVGDLLDRDVVTLRAVGAQQRLEVGRLGAVPEWGLAIRARRTRASLPDRACGKQRLGDWTDVRVAACGGVRRASWPARTCAIGLRRDRHVELRGRQAEPWWRRGGDRVASSLVVVGRARRARSASTEQTARARAGAATLTVRAPGAVRGGLFFQGRLDIVARERIAKPRGRARPGLDGGAAAQHARARAGGRELRGRPARARVRPAAARGDHLTVWLQFEANPTGVGSRDRSVTPARRRSRARPRPRQR